MKISKKRPALAHLKSIWLLKCWSSENFNNQFLKAAISLFLSVGTRIHDLTIFWRVSDHTTDTTRFFSSQTWVQNWQERLKNNFNFFRPYKSFSFNPLLLLLCSLDESVTFNLRQGDAHVSVWHNSQRPTLWIWSHCPSGGGTWWLGNCFEVYERREKIIQTISGLKYFSLLRCSSTYLPRSDLWPGKIAFEILQLDFQLK